MTYPELEKHLKNGRAAAYNIFGTDAWLIESALKRLSSLVTDLPDMNINHIAEKAQAEDIKDTCELLPVMGGLRIVISESPLKKDGAEVINGYLKNPNPSTLLILISGEEPHKGLKNIELIDCAKLSASKAGAIIAETARAANVTLADNAASRLTEYCGNSMARIMSELNKLCGFAGSGGHISAEDVAEMVEPEAEYKIYQLSDAAAKGDGALCMRITAKCIADKIAPSAMLAGLYAHFRRLLYSAVNKGSAESVAAELGVKPYSVESARRQAAAFGARRLKKINDLLNETELNIKSGKIYEYNAFILAVMYILNSKQRLG